MERLHLLCQDFLDEVSFVDDGRFEAHAVSLAVWLLAVDVAAGELQQTII